MTRPVDHHTPATLLVGISNPATADHLVRLSALLADTQPWHVILTHVVQVADQISLTTGQSSPAVVHAKDFLEKARGQAQAAGLETGGLVEVARSVDEGLLAAARSHGARMIVVGHSEPGAEGGAAGGSEERFDRAMHRVARRTRADVVVAKFRRQDMKKILIPVTVGAPLRLTGLVCRALTREEGADLTFFHVAEPGAESDARQDLTARLEGEGLGELGSLEVTTAEDLVDAIVARAADADVVVLGPSGRPRLIDTIISSTGRRIAERLDASVLLAWGSEGAAG